MSEIITLASGIEQVGKTHLGINIALELVRKGHAVGYYHEGSAHRSVHQLLQLRQRSVPKQPDKMSGVSCHGYQGVDIIASRTPLSRWHGLPAEELDELIAAHEIWTGYDDFVIDTSGMSPRAVIACCTLSRLVLLVVTPDPASQAGAFALLRILRLNACSSPVALIVNRVEDTAQGVAIHVRFADQARRHLGLEVPLLASVVHDDHVEAATRQRQTFTSMFPESRAAGCVFRLVEDLLEARAAAGAAAGLADFWSNLAESLRVPVRLPGNVNLTGDEAVEERTEESTVQEDVDESRAEATLLRFEGPLGSMGSVMENFSGVMHFLADDMQAFHERLEDVHSDIYRTAQWSRPDGGVLELTLAAILETVHDRVNRRQKICFQVEEDPVGGEDTSWLAPGYYIKYVLVLSGQDEIIDRVRREMERLPGLGLNKGRDGECICEVISEARDACLSVVHTPQGDLRVNYWHRPDRRKRLRAEESPGVPARKGKTQPSPGTRLH